MLVDRAVNDSTITVEHDREDRSVVTTAGPIQIYMVRISTPSFTHVGTIGLAGTSHEVDSTLFATVVEFTFVKGPGASVGPNHPFPQPEVKVWRDQNLEALKALVETLRKE